MNRLVQLVAGLGIDWLWFFKSGSLMLGFIS